MEAYGIREMPDDYAAEEQDYLGYEEHAEALQPALESEPQLPAIETSISDSHSRDENKLEVSKSPKSRSSSRKSSAKSKRQLYHFLFY